MHDAPPPPPASYPFLGIERDEIPRSGEIVPRPSIRQRRARFPSALRCRPVPGSAALRRIASARLQLHAGTVTVCLPRTDAIGRSTEKETKRNQNVGGSADAPEGKKEDDAADVAWPAGWQQRLEIVVVGAAKKCRKVRAVHLAGSGSVATTAEGRRRRHS